MTSDEEVLSVYPAAIRRKILKHLYLESLVQCYLFKVTPGCSRCCRLPVQLAL
jgi:hypothetical protein